MDFALNDEQQAVVDLAARIFADRVTLERCAEVEAGDEGYDADLWAELARAGLLGTPIPETYGGSGLGYLEVALLLEEAGRVQAPVPLWATLVLGAAPIGAFGTAAQQARWLPAVAAGECVLTAALVEAGSDPEHPVTTATPDGDGWRLDGTKPSVNAGDVADAVLVPAAIAGGGVGVFIVDPAAPGVTVTRLRTTSGAPEARIDLEGVRVGPDEVLGSVEAGPEIVAWMVPRAITGLCAQMAGVCAQALRLTAEYTTTRSQFDRIIATFQAVSQRAADAYIDTQAVSLTARQAAWRLSDDRPSADEVAIAKYWAAEGGQRVVHAAQHLHGGIGVDRSYPLHRCFLAAKQLELTLGGATPSLARLGAAMAAEPV